MRAFAFLCLLHAVFYKANQANEYQWPEDSQEGDNALSKLAHVCSANYAACGCCLMNSTINRMKEQFNKYSESIMGFLKKFNTTLNTIKDNRTAFSVALNNDNTLTCLGPFNESIVIQYKHVFLNYGNGYDVDESIFSAPHTGVYSFAVTVYSVNSTGLDKIACAMLEVNGHLTHLEEKVEGDPEDSNTVILAVKLKVGDKVNVILVNECIICDDQNHYNTFTGYLLYTTDEMH